MDPLVGYVLCVAAGGAAAVVVSRVFGRGAAPADVPPSATPAREADLRAEAARLAGEAKRLDELRREVEASASEWRARIESAAGIDALADRDRALAVLDAELSVERARRVRRVVEATREEAEARARAIVCTAIQRVAASHTSEKTVSCVALPDEMKGRVIGREGRNVRVLERLTGCDVLVDDTPGVLTISAFDPVRREIARRAVVALVADGRIHPERIEEEVRAATRAMEGDLVEAGRKALLAADAGDAHPRVVALLGRLQYRTSYGQNVLAHSVEVAALAGVMAAEMGLDVRIARRVGLFHDLGKAVDHEQEGAHAVLGGEILAACGESALVVNAVASHHEDVAQESAYAVIAQASDAVSAARPGARVDGAERHGRRLKDLEAVASSFEGVAEAYAVQAGREIRVIVDARRVSDDAAVLLAREIARAVEAELAYPGEVKVTVLRETQAIQYAR